jgi:rSAM/selenodomain-associated transferase 1
MIEVLLFAKAPRPGFVKTRLAATLGPQAAAEVYRALGTQIVRQISPVSNITVWFDPPDALLEMRAWLGDHTYRPQPKGGLGERLVHAFAIHFTDASPGPALAIGADAPGVSATIICQASEALADTDVVLGPSRDGGYYLIGLKRPRPELFTAIPWGGGRVLQATLDACGSAGLRVATLPVLRDVDTVEDLTALGLRDP